MHIDTPTLAVLAGLVILALFAIAAWRIYRIKQSKRLMQRFGAEYDHAVTDHGSKSQAESELKAREIRVAKLMLVPLAATEAARFSQAWQMLQGKFIDNPTGVLAEADQLVRDLMVKLGYPMADFTRRAEDISVDHPGVMHYRALFQELLEVRDAANAPAAALKETA